MSTKIHILVDGLGNPLRFIVTPGQAGDAPQAPHLMAGFTFTKLIADKAYDSDAIRDLIRMAKAEAVIPSNPSRSIIIPYDKHIYRERHLVECYINKIKHFRRLATRYEKTELSFLSMLCLIAALIWMR